jgi:pimeloyl-ACP methyl ester carboxylesterase
MELGAPSEIRLSAGTVRYRDAGSGPPLVFVHGLLANGLLWRKVVPLLAEQARCIVPDWPLGAHLPAMDPGADLRPPAVARLIGEFMDELGVEDATVVANDTGGALAQMLVAERPERVGRLVLTSCDSFDNFLPPLFKGLQVASRVPGGLTALVTPLRLRPLRRLPLGFGWLTKRGFPDDVSDALLRPYFTDRGVRRDVRKFIRAISTRDTLAAANALPAYRRPALVAWAREDRVFPLEHGRRLAELLPQARLGVIEDSYSFVPEDQPERLAELVREFLADHS